MVKKSRSPLCVTSPSTLRGAAAKPLPPTTKRHSVRRDGGLHRCGWQPPRLTIDEVANRVWPWKTSGAPPSGARRVAAPSIARVRRCDSSLSHRSVRLPLTTRERAAVELSLRSVAYETRPAHCAPRIIVTLIIERSSCGTRCACARSSTMMPKLPQ